MEFDNNITSVINTLSFLFHNVLKRGFNGVEVFRPEKKINLPVVLSRSEMECLLAALSGLPLFRSGFFTDAGAGTVLRLRINENKPYMVRASLADR